MSHTISTITIIVPTKPKPNISPPSGHLGHQAYPCRHDRPDSGCRLIKTSHHHGSSKWACDLCALRLNLPALPPNRKLRETSDRIACKFRVCLLDLNWTHLQDRSE